MIFRVDQNALRIQLMVPPRAPTALLCVCVRLLHGSAREGMQRYLEEHHAMTWQEQVETNLKIAISTKNGRAYVCKHNLPHEEKWKKSGQAHSE